MSIENSSSCASGEYLVLGEMLRRGYECYLANGPTQNGWDIVVLNEYGANIRIQVKTIDWPEKNAINGKLDDGFDILIAVLLQRSMSHAKYVLPRETKLNLIFQPYRQTRVPREGKRAAENAL